MSSFYSHTKFHVSNQLLVPTIIHLSTWTLYLRRCLLMIIIKHILHEMLISGYSDYMLLQCLIVIMSDNVDIDVVAMVLSWTSGNVLIEVIVFS